MDTSVIRLKQATDDDLELWWQVLRQTMRPYIEATWGWDEANQFARFVAAFDPSFRQIIVLGEQPVGVLHVDTSGTPVRLLNIQLLPAFQRQGYGAALVLAVIRQAHPRPVWLQVLKVNPAKALYERLGFRVIGHTEAHWQMLRDPSA